MAFRSRIMVVSNLSDMIGPADLFKLFLSNSMKNRGYLGKHENMPKHQNIRQHFGSDSFLGRITSL